MRRLITTTALLILIGLPAAIAQTGNSGGSSTAVKNPTIPQAPIGHRQPRASDVPSEKNLSDPNNPYNKEDAALDRKIRSICRGC
ncbi:MAG: hypothetical protein WAV72_27755 [Bradyrhizobium sp.]